MAPLNSKLLFLILLQDSFAKLEMKKLKGGVGKQDTAGRWFFLSGAAGGGSKGGGGGRISWLQELAVREERGVAVLE